METENEHFSNQVKDARQVFMGFPSEKLSQPSVVSVGFEKCLPDFKIERESYPQIGKVIPTINSPRLNSSLLVLENLNLAIPVFNYQQEASFLIKSGLTIGLQVQAMTPW